MLPLDIILVRKLNTTIDLDDSTVLRQTLKKTNSTFTQEDLETSMKPQDMGASGDKQVS